MSEPSFPLFTPRGSPLAQYRGQRHRAWNARLAGDIPAALDAEAAAGRLVDEAARTDADCEAWGTLIEACDELATNPGTAKADWQRLIQYPAPTRAEWIARVAKALGGEQPDANDRAVLRDRGYSEEEAATWAAHIVDTAEEASLRVHAAYSLFALLGPREAFDGFVTACLQTGEEG